MSNPEESLKQFIRDLQTSTQERQVLRHEFSKNLKRELQRLEKQNSDMQPITHIMSQLIDEVAKLRMDVASVAGLQTVNAELERRALNELLSVLEKYGHKQNVNIK